MRSYQFSAFCVSFYFSAPLSQGKYCLSPHLGFFLSSSVTLQHFPSTQWFGNCANGLGGFIAFIFSSTTKELHFASVSLAVLSLASFLISLLNQTLLLVRRGYFFKEAYVNSFEAVLIVFTSVINGLTPVLNDSCPASKCFAFLLATSLLMNKKVKRLHVCENFFLSTLFPFLSSFGKSWRSLRGFL